MAKVVGEPSIMGNQNAPMSSHAVSLNVNPNPFKQLIEVVDKLSIVLKKNAAEWDRLGKAAQTAGASMKGAMGGSGGTASITTASGTTVVTGADSGDGGSLGGFSFMRGLYDRMKGSIAGAGGAVGVAGIAGGMAAAGINTGINTINNRFDRGRDYALSADRMTLLYQQMSGMSQQAVQDAYRQPLTNYKIGMGGINTLLGLQSTTGINAAQQAPSVEAMRMYSGFSMSTQGAANLMANLASPEVANRMFMMGGGGLIGPGGTQRPMQDVLEGIVKQMGLTSPAIMKGAFAPGSITRSRMSMMGLAPDVQDLALQYAQENIAFQQKGGKGMYDARDPMHQKLMGVDSNFATQAEETERTRMEREENFYSRQADNYANLEKQTQKLVEAFGALEDKLSGIIGAVGGNAPAVSIGKKIGGGLLALGGIALTATAPFTGVGAVAGPALTAGGIGFMAAGGDPMPGSGSPKQGRTKKANNDSNDSNITVPTWQGMKTLNEVKSMASFKGMHSEMQKRVLSFLRDYPTTGFGQGLRSYEEQKTMFLQRHYRVDYQTDIYWDGSYWQRKEGMAPAAPPGRSMHGIGLAADLVDNVNGYRDVLAHAAEYGLRHFNDVNNEPWHVQPAELPAGFGDYIKAGAPWGLGTGGGGSIATAEQDMEEEEKAGGSSNIYDGHGAIGGNTGAVGPDRHRSISEKIAQGGYSSGGVSGNSRGPKANGSGTSMAAAVSANNPSGWSGGPLTGEQVAKMLWDVGFRDNKLVKMVAIGKRESGYDPSAHRTNDKEDSYGLFQLNIGPKQEYWDWFKQQGVSDPKEMFDPATNVELAKAFYDYSAQSNNGNGFYWWGDYPGSGPGSSDGGLDIPLAQQVVNNANLGGDPMIPSAPKYTPSKGGGVSGNTSMTVHGGNTFNISVNVNVASASDRDIKKIGKEIGAVVQREIELHALRRS